MSDYISLSRVRNRYLHFSLLFYAHLHLISYLLNVLEVVLNPDRRQMVDGNVICICILSHSGLLEDLIVLELINTRDLGSVIVLLDYKCGCFL